MSVRLRLRQDPLTKLDPQLQSSQEVGLAHLANLVCDEVSIF